MSRGISARRWVRHWKRRRIGVSVIFRYADILLDAAANLVFLFVNAILKTGFPDKLPRAGNQHGQPFQDQILRAVAVPEMLWLRKYKPELAEVDSHTLSIMETGKLPRVKSIEVLKEEEV